MPARVAVVLFASLAGLQLVHSGLRASAVAPHLAEQRALLEGDAESSTGVGLRAVQARAWRGVRALAPEVPEDERVLVLTSVPFGIAFEELLWPRPVSLLIELDEEPWLALAAERPQHAPQILRRLEDIRERGQELTSSGWKSDVSRCDWLLVFELAGEIPETPHELELVAEVGDARLFRRVRGRMLR